MNKYLLTILITLTVSQIVSANNHFSGRNNSSFVCATVFQGKYYSGQSMVISNMEQIQDLSDLTMTSDYYGRRTASWDNKISSIQVASG